MNRIYLRNLNSIFQQQYDNYHVIFIDDASNDNLSLYVQKYMNYNNIPNEKYNIITNQFNKGGLQGIYNAGHNYCELGKVMILIDGDDALVGRQVFSLLNAVYQKNKITLTYGSMFASDGISMNFWPFMHTWPNNEAIQNKKLKFYDKKFSQAHLKTLYVDIFRSIDKSCFQHQNGSFINFHIDVMILEPAFQLVGSKSKLIKQIIYQRTNTRVKKGNHNNQLFNLTQQAIFDSMINIPAQKKYDKMKQMKFADYPKTKYYKSKEVKTN